MKKKRISKKIIIIIGIALVICLGFIANNVIHEIFPYISTPKITNEYLDRLDLDGYDRLMIVAHPDDEMLWGGAELLENNYMVLCITRGYDDVRRSEFEAVMEATGSKGIILSYPDKIYNKRSDWRFCSEDITQDIQTVINYKKWDRVVTHNETGEYGHIHHKKTHSLVMDLYRTDGTNFGEFYVFGTYYKKSAIPEGLDTLPDSTVEKINEINKLYKSQERTITKLGHMIPYQNLTRVE